MYYETMYYPRPASRRRRRERMHEAGYPTSLILPRQLTCGPVTHS